jgi:hypothetical protein
VAVVLGFGVLECGIEGIINARRDEVIATGCMRLIVRKRNRFWLAIASIFGAVWGLVIQLIWFTGPHAFFQVAVVKPLPETNLPDSISVDFAGEYHFSRYSNDPNTFDTEIMLWGCVEPIFFMLIGAIVAILIGVSVDRLFWWLLRKQREQS